MKTNGRLADLSERQLLHRFGDLVRRDRRRTAELLAAISEIDERKLWAKHACSSMFSFCVERFHMSESVAGKRIWAARTARRFPVILAMIARGDLHLNAILKLARHLTEDNHRRVLARARHKSSREIDLLVAELAPRPDVPSRIRALPPPRDSRGPVGSTSNACSCSPPQPRGSGGLVASTGISSACSFTTDAPTAQRTSSAAAHSSPVPSGAAVGSLAASGATSPTAGTDVAGRTGATAGTGATRGFRSTHEQVIPLAPRRYKIEITVDQHTHDKLRMLEDLLGHQLPTTDPAVIVSRAIDRLLDETLKKKAALTKRATSGTQSSDPSEPRSSSRRTRTIPAAVRREVWQRDGGRCTFVDRRGRRCRARRLIEFHHERPFGKGGRHKTGNIALRCRAHNQYAAELDFGTAFMRSKRGRDGKHSARNVGEIAPG